MSYETNNVTENIALTVEPSEVEAAKAAYRLLVDELAPERVAAEDDRLILEAQIARDIGDGETMMQTSANLAQLDRAVKHREAAQRNLENMQRHPEQIWCNSDTVLGQKAADFIETAPAPAAQHFIGHNDHRIRDILQRPDKLVFSVMPGEEPLTIRTTAFVGAELFDKSWEEGRGDTSEKRDDADGTKLTSSQMIVRYAAMPPETAPAVERVDGFIQPDGNTVYISSNAHRVAAAIMRGGEVIRVKEVHLRHIDEQLVKD